MKSITCVVSALALLPIGFAINKLDCVLVGYLTDSYATFASSAFASFSMVRFGLSATFPLFAHGMYTSMGADYATTTLAGVATLICFCPVVLLRCGKRIRQASRFAQYNLTIDRSISASPMREIPSLGPFALKGQRKDCCHFPRDNESRKNLECSPSFL